MASSVMRRVSTRNLRAHKLRLFLTVFSIVLGTAFVAGSMVFTATVGKAFDSIFDGVANGVSVQITPEDRDAPGVPDDVVADLQSRSGELGIDKIVTDFSGLVTLADADGNPIETGGAPSIGTAYIPEDQSLAPEESALMPGGRAPSASDEIVLNRSAAETANLSVGSRTKFVVSQGTAPPSEVTVVGLVDPESATGGFVNVQFYEQTARELFSDGSHVGSVSMAAAPGVSDTELRDRVAAALPTDGIAYEVRTGDQVRQDEKDQVNEFLSVFTGILLAFAGIGLIVGTFIIYNTFSMIVAQRLRELALLRAVGASRKQVSRSVLFEAFIVGIIGGAIGLAAGIGLAAILKAITASSGLPDAPLAITPAAILAAMFVGIVVTMVSAWVPALRAAKVPPVEAMRESAAEGSASLRNRTMAGLIIGVIGLALLVFGAMGEGLARAIAVGGGGAALVLAVVLAGPALARPVVGVLGRVLGAPFGLVGRLARTNAVRNPRRSSATAFALTLGLMLVAVIGTLGASFQATVDDAVDTGLTSDFIISGSNQSPLPGGVASAVTDVEGVGDAVSIAPVQVTIDGESRQGSAPVGGDVTQVIRMEMKDGASSQLPADGMFVSQQASDDYGWKVGDVLNFRTLAGEEFPVTVAGLYEGSEVSGQWMVGTEVYERSVPEAFRMSFGIFVKAADGFDKETLRTNLEDATRPYLTAQVQDLEQFKAELSTTIDQMLATLYAMLGLALLVAILGIVNTLALSVVERKREIGMLRAIGMLRVQVRRTIYLESVLIAIFGALLGVLLGTGIGWALVRTLARWGLGDPVIPWSLIGFTLVAAAVVGVLAALWPAIRAARTRPLEAITDA